VIQEEPLAAWQNLDLLCSMLQVNLQMTPVSTPHHRHASVWTVNQILLFPDLVDLLLERDHSELAKTLDQLELLHVQGPQARVVKIAWT
jgi:hypothetical protein